MALLIAYFASLLAIGLLDALWLGWLARDFYQREIGALMRADILKLPALLFYLGYPAGLLLLALQPRPEHLGEALARCALMGLVAYGTYDLTNLATLKGWPLKLVLVDMAWGVTVSVAGGAAGWWALGRWR